MENSKELVVMNNTILKKFIYKVNKAQRRIYLKIPKDMLMRAPKTLSPTSSFLKDTNLPPGIFAEITGRSTDYLFYTIHV